jgi:hypothetical protein
MFNLEAFLQKAKAQDPSLKVDPETDLQLGLRVQDQVDGRIVLSNHATLMPANRALTTAVLEHQDMQIQVIQGNAAVTSDPYTGNTLVTPRGTVPVKIRQVVETSYQGSPLTVTGPEQTIGIGIENVAADQRAFAAAGGGACGAAGTLAGMPVNFDLRVRAFMPANVIPLSLSERTIYWQQGLYFAWDQQVGLMRLYNNPDFRSQTTLKSRAQAGGTSFFPASGQNDLYFVLEMLDWGLKCFNKKPMIQAYDSTPWPPYSTALSISEPVEFFSTENPDLVMITIRRNDMQIYDYTSIQVECIAQKLSGDGVLDSRWRITNQSKSAAKGRWFFLGDYDPLPGHWDQGSRYLAPHGSMGSSFELGFRAQIRKSVLTRRLSLHYVNLLEPVLMGAHRIEFHYPGSPES